MTFRRGVPFLALLTATIASIACGGGSSGSTAQLRFLQGSPDAPLMNFVVDGKTQAGNLAFGNASSYVTLSDKSHHVQLIPTNSTTPLVDQNLSLTASVDQTIYLTGPVAHSTTLILKDAGTTTTTGDGHVRVLNISTVMGPADVYIVGAGSGLSGATPVASAMDFGQDSGYSLFVAGNYQVYLTQPSTLNTYLTTGALNLTSGQNQTVVVRDAPGGGFTFSVLTDQ